MEYRYCGNENFEDFSSGRALCGGAGLPNFPVRLGNEIFRRCLCHADKKSGLTLYDPCCGGGYLLTVLGFCNPEISALVGSDVDGTALFVAEKNLSLLSGEGLDRRRAELTALARAYGKESHWEALASLERLRDRVRSREIVCRTLRADCTQPLPGGIEPDVIVTDVPYGNLAEWSGDAESSLESMYRQLAAISRDGTVLAVSMDKKARPAVLPWRRLERQQVGKRRFEIYRLG